MSTAPTYADTPALTFTLLLSLPSPGHRLCALPPPPLPSHRGRLGCCGGGGGRRREECGLDLVAQGEEGVGAEPRGRGWGGVGEGRAEARPLPRALSAERVYRPGRARAGQREGWVAAPPTAGCPAHRLCPRGPPPRVTLGGCTHTGWWITRPATSSSDPFCFLQGPVEVSTSQT